jgi:hypothetical protein
MGTSHGSLCVLPIFPHRSTAAGYIMAILAIGCIAVAMQSSVKPVEAMQVEVGVRSCSCLVTLPNPRHAENTLQAAMGCWCACVHGIRAKRASRAYECIRDEDKDVRLTKSAVPQGLQHPDGPDEHAEPGPHKLGRRQEAGII